MKFEACEGDSVRNMCGLERAHGYILRKFDLRLWSEIRQIEIREQEQRRQRRSPAASKRAKQVEAPVAKKRPQRKRRRRQVGRRERARARAEAEAGTAAAVAKILKATKAELKAHGEPVSPARARRFPRSVRPTAPPSLCPPARRAPQVTFESTPLDSDGDGSSRDVVMKVEGVKMSQLDTEWLSSVTRANVKAFSGPQWSMFAMRALSVVAGSCEWDIRKLWDLAFPQIAAESLFDVAKPASAEADVPEPVDGADQLGASSDEGEGEGVPEDQYDPYNGGDMSDSDDGRW